MAARTRRTEEARVSETGFHHKLLIPGWAGSISRDEAKFIQEELRRRPGLRKRWNVGKRPTLQAIARAAYPEDPNATVQS